LPGIVHEGMKYIALPLPLGNGQRDGGLVDIPQQEFGEGISAGTGRTLRCIGIEGVLAARILIADLVEILAIVFEAEFEAVLALEPGKVVDHLSSVVFVFKRAIGIIAEAAETIPREGDAGDAP